MLFALAYKYHQDALRLLLSVGSAAFAIRGAGQCLIFLLACSAAVALYFLKRDHLLYYGMMETGFAASAVWVAVWQLETSAGLAVWLALGSAIYVVVRGLSNTADGLGQRDDRGAVAKNR